MELAQDPRREAFARGARSQSTGGGSKRDAFAAGATMQSPPQAPVQQPQGDGQQGQPPSIAPPQQPRQRVVQAPPNTLAQEVTDAGFVGPVRQEVIDEQRQQVDNLPELRRTASPSGNREAARRHGVSGSEVSAQGRGRSVVSGAQAPPSPDELYNPQQMQAARESLAPEPVAQAGSTHVQPQATLPPVEQEEQAPVVSVAEQVQQSFGRFTERVQAYQDDPTEENLLAAQQSYQEAQEAQATLRQLDQIWTGEYLSEAAVANRRHERGETRAAQWGSAGQRLGESLRGIVGLNTDPESVGFIQNMVHQFAQSTLPDMMGSVFEAGAVFAPSAYDDVREQGTYAAAQWLRGLASGLYPTNPELQENFVATQLPMIMGSLAQYIGGAAGVARGATARGATQASARMQAGGFSMGLAGAQGTSEVYERARMAGGDLDQSETAARWGFIPGSIQATPIFSFLGRADRATGGQLHSSLMRRLMQRFPSGRDITAAAFEEAFMETMGQGGFNLILREMIDQDQSLAEGLQEAALIGGGAGAFAQIILSSIGGSGRTRVSRLDSGEAQGLGAPPSDGALRLPELPSTQQSHGDGALIPDVAPSAPERSGDIIGDRQENLSPDMTQQIPEVATEVRPAPEVTAEAQPLPASAPVDQVALDAAEQTQQVADYPAARSNDPALGAELRTRIAEDFEGAEREYAALTDEFDTQGGVVLNTDLARELSPGYRADRTRSSEVHEAASDFIKAKYRRMLARPTPEGKQPVVLFTAGGTGAGKTTGVRALGTAVSPEIVYDTNMNSFESAVDKIDQALAAGRGARILYTYRDPIDALINGAIPRAVRMAQDQGSGRTVPIEEHVRTHAGSRRTIERLAEHYANEERVQIRVFDNSRGRDNGIFVDLDSIPQLQEESLYERAIREIESSRDQIPGDIYRGFVGQADVSGGVQGVRPEAREGLGRGNEEGAEGQVGPGEGTGSGWGSSNRIVTQERAEEIRRKIREDMGRAQSGISPQQLALAAELAVFHVEAGARTFADFAARMVRDFGESIRPHLGALWDRTRTLEGIGGDGQSASFQGEPPGPPTPTQQTHPDDPFAFFPERLRQVQAEQQPFESGRPELSNPAETTEVRRAVDTVDQIMKEAGLPGRQTFEQWNREADRRLSADYEGEKSRLFSGETSLDDPVGVTIARKIIEREGQVALESSDRETLIRFARLTHDYRRARSETARAMTAGRDSQMTPEERRRQFLTEATLMPDQRVRRRLDRAEEKAKADRAEIERAESRRDNAEKDIAALRSELEGDTSDAQNLQDRITILERQKRAAEQKIARLQKQITETRERLLTRHAEKTQKIVEGLKERGLDPETLNAENDPVKMAQAIHYVQGQRSAWGDMAFEYWLNGLLSMPTTHMVNVSTTVLWALDNVTLQRWAEIGVNFLMPGDRSSAAQAGELPYVYRAFTMSMLRDAFQKGALAWKTETPVFSEQMRDPGRQKAELLARQLAIPGVPGRFVRWPTRLIMYVDEVTKAIIYNMEVVGQAYRIAKAEGLSGEALDTRIAELSADPMSAASREAYQTALEGTFMDDPKSEMARNLMSFRGKHRAAQYIVPFARAPGSLLRQGLRKSPLGSLALMWRMLKHGAYRAELTDNPSARYERHRAVRDIAEQVIAWTGVMALYALTAGDDDREPFITGSGASFRDRGKREMEMRVLPPRSIRIGNTWYSYSRWEPFASRISHTVDGVNAVRRSMGGDGVDFQREFGKAFDGMVASVRDQSFLMGVGDIIRAIEDGDSALRWASNFATSWVPNIVRGTARSMDPFIRNYSVRGDGNEWLGELVTTTAQQAVPAPQWAPPPRVDWLGQERRRSQSPVPNTDFVYRMVMPAWTVRMEGPVEFDRLVLNWNNQNPRDEWYPSLPAPAISINGERIRLTKEEEHKYLKRSGELTLQNLQHWATELGEERWDEIVSNPTEEHIKVLQKIIESSRSSAREEMQDDVWIRYRSSKED